MIRTLLVIILLMVAYDAVNTVFRSMDAYHGGEPRPPRIPGEEMVQDPQCRTSVVKGRAVIRRSGGRTRYFCSDACADAYERHLR